MLAKLAGQLQLLLSHPATRQHTILQHMQGDINAKCRIMFQGHKVRKVLVQYLINRSFVTIHMH